MLSVDYYHKLKEQFSQEVHKSVFIYLYTMDGVVAQVGFRFRKKNKFKLIRDVPHEKLLLTRENKKLPQAVIVQIKMAPLTFTLLEG